MQFRLVLATCLLSLAFVSCKKAAKNPDFNLPKKNTEQYKLKRVTKSGHRCDLVGSNENKEVFLEVERKNGEVTARFHDFISKDSITVTNAKFAGFTLMSFKMSESGEENNKILTGDAAILHEDVKSLSDEGEVNSANGKLTLNADMLGVLEVKLFITGEDKSLLITPYSELARIENCQAFEAIWL